MQNKANNYSGNLSDGFESSADEGELDEKDIIEKLYRNYTYASNNELPLRTSNFLENFLHSGSATCLICIGNIKRAQAIWSCKHCHCFFHLVCIKRWANDSLLQIKGQSNHDFNHGYYNNMGVYVGPKKPREPKWNCPQCRQDYKLNESPVDYTCFCGKTFNPTVQPWLVPHSCGEICEKDLQPKCGHKCLLLCHPGPCPPCPQNVNVSCICGRSTPKLLRCFQKTWMCERQCSNILSCGKHRCENQCHKILQCPPCNRSSLQFCACKSESTILRCSEPIWHCKKVCNRKYPCGIHSCEKVCHSDPCGECPLSLQRSCPCGKIKRVGPCNETIDSCGDTCQKILSCGIHSCNQRCHKGECHTCLVVTRKKCRCGKHEKELPCWKRFTCETKCRQLRECGKHNCNKKCCDGLCAPCDKICGKILSCRKHKCKSICHRGPCYPCEQTSRVSCRCGTTAKTVPCGRKSTVRIKCPELCRFPSKCHHKVSHSCHKDECPPCNEKCGLINDTTGCGHVCEARCHAAIQFVKNTLRKNDVTLQSSPHPKCEIKVVVTCIGGHETSEWPCWNSFPKSCFRLCNRLLKCGNHYCSLVCHAVKDTNNMEEQEGCSSCSKGCNLPRPSGCIHPCQQPCHQPPCQPCNAIIKAKCHCGLVPLVFKCAEYYSTESSTEKVVDVRERMQSCGGRCAKNLSCGHRCPRICHSGLCENVVSCYKKVRIFCACKRIKIEISCGKHRSGLTSVPCDEKCTQLQLALDNLRNQEEEREKLLNEVKDRRELEQYQKRVGVRKYKKRKTSPETVKVIVDCKLVLIYTGFGLAVILAFCLAVFIQ